ncbi:Cell division protein FtsL [Trichinella spiralis]|uniref:Cell division protein FtsL n=1 Tax=Trichinella spiralis TaxID=6334 RepID=A0ABR3KNC7_TRISP
MTKFVPRIFYRDDKPINSVESTILTTNNLQHEEKQEQKRSQNRDGRVRKKYANDQGNTQYHDTISNRHLFGDGLPYCLFFCVAFAVHLLVYVHRKRILFCIAQRTSHVAEENSFNPEDDFTSCFRWSLCQWTSDPVIIIQK